VSAFIYDTGSKYFVTQSGTPGDSPVSYKLTLISGIIL